MGNDNFVLETATTSKCPGCGYAEIDDSFFASCPKCGLIISKYLKRQEKQSLQSQKTPAFSGITESLTMTSLNASWKWIACVLFILLFCGVLSVKFSTFYQHRDRKTEEQEKALKFHRAISNGEKDKVQRMLIWGMNPNVKFNNQTALETAVKAGDLEVAAILVDKGADFHSMGENGKFLFLQTVNYNNTNNALFLLGIGADANASFPGGTTALMIAAYFGNKELVLALVGKGANVNAVNRDGRTALIDAARKKHVDIMKILLDRGASVSARSSDGYTALRIAQEGRNSAMVELLLKAGALE